MKTLLFTAIIGHTLIGLATFSQGPLAPDSAPDPLIAIL